MGGWSKSYDAMHDQTYIRQIGGGLGTRNKFLNTFFLKGKMSVFFRKNVGSVNLLKIRHFS